MTQGIRKLLDLPSLEEALKAQGIDPNELSEPDMPDVAADDAAAARRVVIENSRYDDRLAAIDGTDHADAMDRIHKETLKHAGDIMDLGFNIDHARAARMFEVAAIMYARSIEAKTHKRDAQLKAVKLALDQRKIDLEERRLRHDIGDPGTLAAGSATVVVEDRNEIIKAARLRMQQDRVAGL